MDNMDNKENLNIPPKYKPLGAWAYFGYNLLFSLPLIGFIMLIVYSFDDSNINRRNYARSFWCVYAVAVIAVVLTVILSVTSALAFSEIFESTMTV